MTASDLFDYAEDWRREWHAMPEFIQEDLTPTRSVLVHFAEESDVRAFAKLVEQEIGPRTRSLWYPEAEIGRFANKRYATPDVVLPSAPIYIVSKGRAELQLTSRHLTAMGVPHYVVVGAFEADIYRKTLAESLASVLVLDEEYRRRYETCDDLGLDKPTGAGPARNFAWDHSIAAGYAWHWVMDDNIDGFFRLNRNLKTPCVSGAFFLAMETFAARYSNVAMAGPHYFMFASRKTKLRPFTRNRRIYSCNLIRNDLPFRWRSRLNDDTDLSLRILKSGRATILFNAFLAFKVTTMTMPGGYNEDFYKKEGRGPATETLVRLHPDVARATYKFGRIHHDVDYSSFRNNPLGARADTNGASEIDDFGMRLELRSASGWRPADEDLPPFEDIPAEGPAVQGSLF